MSQSGEATQKVVRDYAIAVAIAVLIALLLRSFVIEAYRIPSPAMKPTLQPGDTIFVSKSAFGLRLPGARNAFTKGRLPKRGEVVVFTSPSDPDREYIKRVIALPGERVQIKTGNLFINGNIVTISISPPLTAPGSISSCGTEALPPKKPGDSPVIHGTCWEPPMLEDFASTVVPENSIFLMGDLRSSGEGPQRQTPGENWGIIPLSSLRGAALWVWLSVEPRGIEGGFLPGLRFERMFRRIN